MFPAPLERERQIDTLKIFNDNVVEIVKNEEYTVGFKSGDHDICMTVRLGPAFPDEKPRIFIQPILNHNWIHLSTGEIQHAPGLVNFSEHSDLGLVVQAIIREYEKFPPPLISSTTGQPSNFTNQKQRPPKPQKQQQRQRISSIPELNNLSTEELTRLCNDNIFFEDFVEELPPIKKLDIDLENLMTDVEQLAAENITKQKQLNLLKSQIESEIDTFRQLGIHYNELCQKYDKQAEDFEPTHIRELLQIAAATADSECESVIENFIGGKLDVQSFLNQFLELKKISTLRKAKEERLAHQLNAIGRSRY